MQINIIKYTSQQSLCVYMFRHFYAIIREQGIAKTPDDDIKMSKHVGV